VTADSFDSLPFRWLLLSVEAPPAGEEHLLVEALRRLGARSVERERERYVALVPPPVVPEALVRQAEAVIRTSTSLRDPSLAWAWQSSEAWAEAWTRALEPRRVGEHLVVAPVGREPRLLPGDLVIRLVPGPGFGTAEHPTTRGCLRLLESVVAPGDRVADVGSGSAILAVAAVRLGAGRVVAYEMDAHACAAARRTVVENGVADRVEVRQEEVGPEGLSDGDGFDGVTANLPGNVLLPLLPALARSVVEGGWLVVSGLNRGERPDVLTVTEDSGLRLDTEEVEEGWWSARLRRPGRGRPAPSR
jgi:ribosomal protein L11 methyltransferase